MTMTKFKEHLLNTALVVFFLLGLLSTILVGAKIVGTALTMGRISSDIVYLHDLAAHTSTGGWSPEMSEKFLALEEEREALQTSGDPIVNWFACSSKLMKMVAILIVIIMYAGIFFLLWNFLKAVAYRIRKVFRRLLKK